MPVVSPVAAMFPVWLMVMMSTPTPVAAVFRLPVVLIPMTMAMARGRVAELRWCGSYPVSSICMAISPVVPVVGLCQRWRQHNASQDSDKEQKP